LVKTIGVKVYVTQLPPHACAYVRAESLRGALGRFRHESAEARREADEQLELGARALASGSVTHASAGEPGAH
jgi:hypothetical protein